MRPDWMSRAACIGLDPELFFPVETAGGAEAVQVCASCPVRTECLAHAVATDARHGVWGGVREAERQAARLRRPPTCPDCGRPRDPRYKRCPACQLVARRRMSVESDRRARLAS